MGVRVIAGATAVILAIGGGAAGYRAYNTQAATAKSCAAVNKQILDRGEAVTIPGTEPATYILGDSYTAGDGLEEYRDGWAYQYAQLTGTFTSVAGVGQTGYVNGGYCGGQTFAERLPKATSTLIIQGGLNDSENTADEIRNAATALLASVTTTETVILVGPLDVNGYDNEATVDKILKAAATDADRVYVSALNWDVELQEDGVHPNEKGAHEYATLLAQALN